MKAESPWTFYSNILDSHDRSNGCWLASVGYYKATVITLPELGVCWLVRRGREDVRSDSAPSVYDAKVACAQLISAHVEADLTPRKEDSHGA